MKIVDGFSGTYSLDPHHWEGGFWGKQIFEFTNNPTNPLTCELKGTMYRPDNHFFSDLGSVPKSLQTLLPKWFAKDRYPLSYLYHDSGYKHGGHWVAAPGDWHFIKMTRKQVDNILREMIILEGGGKANARTIWLGVWAGGWASWKGK